MVTRRMNERQRKKIGKSLNRNPNKMESMKHGRVLLQIIYHNLVRIQFRFFLSFLLELHTLYVVAGATVFVWRRALIHEPCAGVGRWNAACSVNHIVITVLFRCLLDVYYPFASMLNNKFSLRPPASAALRARVREVQNENAKKCTNKGVRERERKRGKTARISLFIMKCVERVSNMLALCSVHFRTNNLQIGYKFSYGINSMLRFYANDIFCDFGAVA